MAVSSKHVEASRRESVPVQRIGRWGLGGQVTSDDEADRLHRHTPQPGKPLSCPNHRRPDRLGVDPTGRDHRGGRAAKRRSDKLAPGNALSGPHDALHFTQRLAESPGQR